MLENSILSRGVDCKLFHVVVLGTVTMIRSVDGETDVIRLKGRGPIFEEHVSINDQNVSYFVRCNGRPISDGLAKAFDQANG